MSGKSPASLAMTGAVMTIGGLAFARLGWRGLRAPRAPAHSLAGIDTPARPPILKLALFAAILLFGLFILGCGLLLILALFLPEAQT
jgi:hypothetical protein